MAGARRTAGGPQGHDGWSASLVEGHLAHGRGLLLDARLPARHRSAGSGRRRADRDGHSRAGDALGRAACLRSGRGTKLCGTGIDRPAREPAGRLERKSAGPGTPRFRRDGLRHHDDAVGSRRRQARHRKPVPPRCDRRAPGSRDARDPGRRGRGLSEGLLRGHWPGPGGCPALPGPEPRRSGSRRVRGAHAP